MLTAGSSKKNLLNFKRKIKARPVDFWIDSTDLSKKVSISLPKLFANNPRPGWERSQSEDSLYIAKQLARLAEENDQLKSQIKESIPTYGGSEVNQILRVLTDPNVSLRKILMKSMDKQYDFIINLLTIFILIPTYFDGLALRTRFDGSQDSFGRHFWSMINKEYFKSELEVGSLKFLEGRKYFIEPVLALEKMRLIKVKEGYSHGAEIDLDNNACLTDLGYKVFLEAQMRGLKTTVEHAEVTKIEST